ncbi:uncharacterized protein BJ212DRAFT_1302326 [Suillus subaureus]|uniref:Uncharacterized protein n=1 Tax=Suillus subaureus TaxID=48587 RepID=A0A9P7E4L3_9AGAM|nr:uncharacterized protein BJ212DRAFT_1302326 [Suillus subaureus]KAG1810582.1 hypothetical protein BJ212DRAFT_1302326 [Suillus subaureus]
MTALTQVSPRAINKTLGIKYITEDEEDLRVKKWFQERHHWRRMDGFARCGMRPVTMPTGERVVEEMKPTSKSSGKGDKYFWQNEQEAQQDQQDREAQQGDMKRLSGPY